MNNLTFGQTESICNVLGKFADSKVETFDNFRPVPFAYDKLLLVIRKIEGRETLEAVRESRLTWYEYIVRWFNAGGAYIGNVAKFLEINEPYLPKGDFNRELYANHYEEEEIDKMRDLDRESFKKLRYAKRAGCDIFKRCVNHHNLKHSKQVHVLFYEYDRIDLTNSDERPMGGNLKKYRAPIIDQNKFLFLNPVYRSKSSLSSSAKGFCYENGLGTDKNIEEAKKYYRLGVQQEDYSACYHLGRLEHDKKLIEKAKSIITNRIASLSAFPARLRANQDGSEEIRKLRLEKAKEVEDRNAPKIAKLQKHLKKVNEYRPVGWNFDLTSKVEEIS